ncbi:hypothetical protein EGR_03737 [Echinococcus granulosus]|uniref:Uncharacterized protein n=1 Tax=Echinococcus granulosus TaxID=6210 RepID=W6UT01_ECHGR|nr:hypothetical protein EGR_03737 [Echinococcus granulosus]EUB61447.1 hypothetical protein EGR_03737 [Echinococcus granulosus]
MSEMYSFFKPKRWHFPYFKCLFELSTCLLKFLHKIFTTNSVQILSALKFPLTDEDGLLESSSQKSPSTFGNVCQCSALPRCCRSSPSAQGEAMGTYYQPLERNPIQPFGCLDFPKTTATSNISTGTMAYLCKLNTPLRKTEHLFADGNCVRARRSIVELGDLNTLNNCTTSCPMIAEHCTYKQQHQHHGCTENPDECRSLQDVRLTMAHSRKIGFTSMLFYEDVILDLAPIFNEGRQHLAVKFFLGPRRGNSDCNMEKDAMVYSGLAILRERKYSLEHIRNCKIAATLSPIQ